MALVHLAAFSGTGEGMVLFLFMASGGFKAHTPGPAGFFFFSFLEIIVGLLVSSTGIKGAQGAGVWRSYLQLAT